MCSLNLLDMLTPIVMKRLSLAGPGYFRFRVRFRVSGFRVYRLEVSLKSHGIHTFRRNIVFVVSGLNWS